VSWIEINPDLKRLTAAAERIAFSLEQFMLHQFGIHPKPAREGKPGSEDDVTYATDEGTLRREVEIAVMPETVREREGAEVEEEIGRG